MSNTEKLCFKDSSFDLVVSREMLEHLQDQKSGVKEMNRVLKPSGIVVLSTPSFFGLIAPFYFLKKFLRGMQIVDEWFSPFSLQKLFEENGFKIVSLKSIHFIPYHGRLPGALVKAINLIDSFIERIPFLNLLGRNLIIKAKKIS